MAKNERIEKWAWRAVVKSQHKRFKAQQLNVRGWDIRQELIYREGKGEQLRMKIRYVSEHLPSSNVQENSDNEALEYFWRLD